ncbi:hypothetical protein PAPYR_942 [Paratrimastix pyriformis]|uniref:Uncharacterized protein n=1 Tax=Paratrimastix pyriformis TaxID=342808 RepID=A0ABQ8UZV1_9EUKA|nr:hypothetical protein PAPYR_942 [Paratrimastix pyriformis]
MGGDLSRPRKDPPRRTTRAKVCSFFWSFSSSKLRFQSPPPPHLEHDPGPPLETSPPSEPQAESQCADVGVDVDVQEPGEEPSGWDPFALLSDDALTVILLSSSAISDHIRFRAVCERWKALLHRRCRLSTVESTAVDPLDPDWPIRADLPLIVSDMMGMLLSEMTTGLETLILDGLVLPLNRGETLRPWPALPALRTLSLRRTSVPVEVLRPFLAGAPRLETLIMDDMPPSVLETLRSHCPCLETLSAFRWRISTLPGLPRLRHLAAKGLAHFQTLPTAGLESLVLDDILHHRGLERVAPSLRHLRIRIGPELPGDSPPSLLPLLTSLALVGNVRNSATLLGLVRASPALERFVLADGYFGTVAGTQDRELVQALARSPRLREVVLRPVVGALPDLVLGCAELLGRVERLVVQRGGYGSPGVGTGTGTGTGALNLTDQTAPRLADLELVNITATRATISLRALRALRLWDFRADAALLVDCPALGQLDLTRVTAAPIGLRCPDLGILTLPEEPRPGAPGVEFLAAMPHLRVLYANRNPEAVWLGLGQHAPRLAKIHRARIVHPWLTTPRLARDLGAALSRLHLIYGTQGCLAAPLACPAGLQALTVAFEQQAREATASLTITGAGLQQLTLQNPEGVERLSLGCPGLRELALETAPALRQIALTCPAAPPLERLSLHKCGSLEPEALRAGLLEACGPTLLSLRVSQWGAAAEGQGWELPRMPRLGQLTVDGAPRLVALTLVRCRALSRLTVSHCAVLALVRLATGRLRTLEIDGCPALATVRLVGTPRGQLARCALPPKAHLLAS